MNTDELRAIAEAATPGPWEWNAPELMVQGPGPDEAPRCVIEDEGFDYSEAERNGPYIATFNPARILAMLDVIEAADDPAVYDVMSDTTMYPAHKRLAAALARLREVK